LSRRRAAFGSARIAQTEPFLPIDNLPDPHTVVGPHGHQIATRDHGSTNSQFNRLIHGMIELNERSCRQSDHFPDGQYRPSENDGKWQLQVDDPVQTRQNILCLRNLLPSKPGLGICDWGDALKYCARPGSMAATMGGSSLPRIAIFTAILSPAFSADAPSIAPSPHLIFFLEFGAQHIGGCDEGPRHNLDISIAQIIARGRGTWVRGKGGPRWLRRRRSKRFLLGSDSDPPKRKGCFHHKSESFTAAGNSALAAFQVTFGFSPEIVSMARSNCEIQCWKNGELRSVAGAHRITFRWSMALRLLLRQAQTACRRRPKSVRPSLRPWRALPPTR
jgi:hypothetical protein